MTLPMNGERGGGIFWLPEFPLLLSSRVMQASQHERYNAAAATKIPLRLTTLAPPPPSIMQVCYFCTMCILFSSPLFAPWMHAKTRRIKGKGGPPFRFPFLGDGGRYQAMKTQKGILTFDNISAISAIAKEKPFV